MNLKDGATLVADLTTTGRKSGLARAVELRFLFFQGNFYATSTRVARQTLVSEHDQEQRRRYHG